VDGELLAEISLPAGQRSGKSLAPAIDRLLKQVGWRPREVALVSVTAGPGSFTGLRIGVTTAKTFAYATDADVLAVDTLDVLAEQASGNLSRLEATLTAERGQLFCATFVSDGEHRLARSGSNRLIDQDEWLASLPAETAVTGPPMEKLASRLPAGVLIVEPTQRLPTAAAVGRLAARLYANGQRDDLWALVPQYGRPSAAEEKWNAQRPTAPPAKLE
jgi:tRNA threonylcarbamoyladenosine biosynthesis protein TsaB